MLNWTIYFLVQGIGLGAHIGSGRVLASGLRPTHHRGFVPRPLGHPSGGGSGPHPSATGHAAQVHIHSAGQSEARAMAVGA